MQSSFYKYCIVPQCKSTSIKTPNKIFIYVPHNKTIRLKWLSLARRDDALSFSPNTKMYFCEDHFNLPNDMANYMEFHVMGYVSQILMKPGCMPSKFHCQLGRRKQTSKPNILKKQRKKLIEDCQKDLEEISSKQMKLEEFSYGNSVKLEVCIDSLESAINAIHGGAHELEVCSSLISEGGLTPSVGLVIEIMKMHSRLKQRKTILDSCNGCSCKSRFSDENIFKVNVMIRCRSGSDFCYNEEEMKTMITDIQFLQTLNVHRFVFGALNLYRTIDEDNCSRIIKEASPIPVTFHRAFDLCENINEGMESIIKLGFDRLLTSGQKPSVIEGLETIEYLQENYGRQIAIMPGAGVNINNIGNILNVKCNFVHSSCKVLRDSFKFENDLDMGPNKIYVTEEKLVRDMVSFLEENSVKHDS